MYARFLSTLERHFKALASPSSTFAVITDTIPSLMNALRMVWIISRHYNRDERMVPLMKRIAWQLRQRVYDSILIRELFKLVDFLFSSLTPISHSLSYKHTGKYFEILHSSMFRACPWGRTFHWSNNEELLSNPETILNPI